jgi:hypothetical protein
LPFDWDPNRETMGEYLGRTWPGNGSPGSAGAQPSGAPQPGPPAPAAAPPAAPPAYMSDPSYLAFKRALGLEQSTAERGTNDQIDALNRTRGQQLDQLGHYGERSRRDIQGAMESRGSLRSSETVDRLGEQRYGEGVAASQLNDATAERVAALRQALAEQQAGFNTRDTEAQLASTGQSEWQHQQDALMKALTQASATPPPVTGMPDFQQQSLGSMTVGKATGLSPAEAWIVQHESGGNPSATNPSSGAFGIAQFLPSNLPTYAKAAGVSNPRTTDPAEQVAMMRAYIKQRYGSAENAQAFWRSHNWY